MSKPLTAQRLRKTNIYAGILHFVQMAAVLALSSDFSLPINATYMSGPPGTTYAPPVTLFETPIGLTVAILLPLLSSKWQVLSKICRRISCKA
jgi:hypothetical protein